MSSNYQQKKMMNALGAIDTKGNIVLEQFQDGTALLFQSSNAQPFCVATDDAVVATNRFRELDARFKSHDGMDLDPSTPEIESGYEFNRRSIEDDRAADDRNSISDQDIDSRL